MKRSDIAAQLFGLSPDIRYVAMNQGGRIVEMAQNPRWPSHNPSETDRLEELIVNPMILELTRRRGELDLSGVQFVVIRYGPLYQVLLPYGNGHLSVSVEPGADVIRIAEDVKTYVTSTSPPHGSV